MGIRSWVTGLMLAISTSASAGSPCVTEKQVATREEVVEKVRAAVEMLATVGHEALPLIADPESEFVWKDTYVFVVDCDADRVMANPRFPERVGGDIKQHTDYVGFRYGTSLCEKARLPKGGWITYQWPRSGSSEPLTKTSFVLSVPGVPLQVGAGVYLEGADGRYVDHHYMHDTHQQAQHARDRHSRSQEGKHPGGDATD